MVHWKYEHVHKTNEKCKRKGEWANKKGGGGASHCQFTKSQRKIWNRREIAAKSASCHQESSKKKETTKEIEKEGDEDERGEMNQKKEEEEEEEEKVQ